MDEQQTTTELPREPFEGFAPKDREVVQELALTAREVMSELGLPGVSSLDILFLAFLRKEARFGVFSFGPVTIYVPIVEELVAREAREHWSPDQATREFARFSEALHAEHRRGGRRRIDELTVLLTFMRIGEGVPGKVFAELGVSPAQVEAYARSGGTAVDLEPLYSPEEAAEYLGIHVQTVRAWIRSGRLPAHRLAGQRALRIKASDLSSVLEPVEPGRDVP